MILYVSYSGNGVLVYGEKFLILPYRTLSRISLVMGMAESVTSNTRGMLLVYKG